MTSTDHFSTAFENGYIKIISISVSFISSLIILPFLYGIIWYERYGTDVKRILLNRIVSSVCWSFFEYFTLAYTLDIVRYTFGPLPYFLCVGQGLVKNSVHIQNFLFCNAIAIIRYLLFFWLRNISEFQDEFWSNFINIWVVSFSVISQTVFILMPGSPTTGFFICIGQDPGVGGKSKINYIYDIALILSISIQILVAIRIIVHKTKIHENGMNGGGNAETHIWSDILTCLPFLFVSAVAGYLLVKVNGMDAVTIASYPNYLFMYGLHLGVPVVVSGTFCLLFYSRKSAMRTTLFMEAKEFFHSFSTDLTRTVS